MKIENLNTIDLEDIVRIEEFGAVDELSKSKIKRCFNYDFFKEIVEVIHTVSIELNNIAKVTEVKNELVLRTGWPFFRAGRIQEAIAKSKYGDVFIAHTTKLGEIRTNRIGLSITTGKDMKEIIRRPRKYLAERASVNHNLEAQLMLELDSQIKSNAILQVEEKYDITGVLMYSMDDQNRLEVLKIIFFDTSLQHPLLVLHAPQSMLYVYKDEVENQDSDIVDKTNLKEDKYSLKKNLQIK